MSFLGFETPEQVQEETSFEEPVPTIQDFIVMREEMKETRRIDEVFLTIPEVVLIDILMQHGTCLSIKDVVYIYESNNTIYNKVLSGARAQQYRDSLARDSIQTFVNFFLGILVCEDRYTTFQKMTSMWGVSI